MESNFIRIIINVIIVFWVVKKKDKIGYILAGILTILNLIYFYLKGL